MKDSQIAFNRAIDEINYLYMYIKDLNISNSKYDLKEIKKYTDDISYFIKEYYKCLKLESKLNLINSLNKIDKK